MAVDPQVVHWLAEVLHNEAGSLADNLGYAHSNCLLHLLPVTAGSSQSGDDQLFELVLVVVEVSAVSPVYLNVLLLADHWQLERHSIAVQSDGPPLELGGLSVD